MFRLISRGFLLVLLLSTSVVNATNQFIVGTPVVSHDTMFVPVGVQNDRDSLMAFESVIGYPSQLTFLDIDWAGSFVSGWKTKIKGTNPEFATNRVVVAFAMTIGMDSTFSPCANSTTAFAFTMIFKMNSFIANPLFMNAIIEHHISSFVYREGEHGFSVVHVNVVMGNVPTDVNDPTDNLPITYALSSNYPNPFNPTTTIEFTLPVKAHVNITIFNALGQVVATLVNEERSAGKYTAMWDATHCASGMYFYRMTSAKYTETRKMMLLK